MGLKVLGTGWTFGLAALAGAGMAGAQTQPSAPQPQQQTCQLVRDANGNWTADPNCPQTNAPASSAPKAPGTPAAQRFPYPGDGSAPAASAAPTAPASTAPAAQRFPFPGDNSSSAPAAPNAAAGQNQSPAGDTSAPASKRFPFPGDGGTPSAPAAGAPVSGQPPLNDAGSSGQASSSSSSTSSSSSSDSAAGGSQAANPDSTDPDDPGADPAKIEAARRARRKKAEPPPPSPSEREQEDVQVAGFYQNDGDFKGAYGRAQEAVTLDATDPAAHLALAEAARRLGKLDEADKEYKKTLTLDPVPKVRKAAEKALKEMTGGQG